MGRKGSKQVTDRQVEVLRAVAQLRRIGEVPTHSALCTMIGVRSENTVYQHLRALSDHGLVTYQRLVCGGADLTDKGRKLLEKEPP